MWLKQGKVGAGEGKGVKHPSKNCVGDGPEENGQTKEVICTVVQAIADKI